MTRVAYALAILIAWPVFASAQTQIAGTWQAQDGFGAGPLQMVLRVDGSRVTGVVTPCVSRFSAIFEGRIDGNTITFTCRRIDNDGTVLFNGEVNGDEIAFTWELRGGSSPLDGSPFGPSTPRRFIAKRVPDDDIWAAMADEYATGGVEFSATLNLVEKNLRVIGTLFLSTPSAVHVH